MWKQNGKVIKKMDQMGKKEKGGKKFELLGEKKGKRVHSYVCQLSKQMNVWTGTYISPSETNIIHVLINPRASFMSAAIYLTQRQPCHNTS